MVEEAKIVKPDMFEVQYNIERIILHYQYLGKLATMAYHQASKDDNDPKELSRLINMMGHKHAECGADLKAVRRLIS